MLLVNPASRWLLETFFLASVAIIGAVALSVATDWLDMSLGQAVKLAAGYVIMGGIWIEAWAHRHVRGDGL